ncbi:MAG: 6-phospho-beta-glucosidase, partial [Clostridia bacterium]|nr:6-phospho-beta-glucosidase [Clostridia bacterium]
EITCDIRGGEAVPHRFGEVDEQNLELIRRVKIYERLASEAIRTKSVVKAVEALTLHPLVASYSLASELIKEYLLLNKDYTGDWK